MDTCKIEHQSNTMTFVWDCDNLIKSKLKQIMKTNSKWTNYKWIKLKKKIQKGFNKKNWKIEFKKENEKENKRARPNR
jgi:hypothetical protein